MLDEYGAEIDRDLSFYHHLDLREILRPGGKTTWSPSRLLNLIDGLPRGSNFYAKVFGGDDAREYREWSMDTFILANIFDATNTNTAATGMFKKPPKFPAHYRPGHKADDKKLKKSKTPTSLEDAHKAFEALLLSGKAHAL